MSDKVVITCALTGVLTNPEQHPVPVTAKQMAASAKEAYDAGASCMHIHFRQQTQGKGHLPCWEPEVALEISDAIREACPDVIINYTTGTIGRDQKGPIDCIKMGKPEIAACNAGSLNYLKTRSNGTWAWPPMLFQNTVDKIQELLDVCKEEGCRPEFECFDLGIVRSVGMFQEVGMWDRLDYNLVMGVNSGMPADPDLLPIILKYLKPGSHWQATVIGREEVWSVHKKVAELGGNLRTGLEDTFYLPGGEKATSNGQLIEAMAKVARDAGREVASPAEARKIFL
ncbi:MAG: 3-keto-5-aminohexanoate cleavage enzyme [Oceanicoccus sp.]|jgi:3-keto-5-aminohexanoate cleavage enzyme